MAEIKDIWKRIYLTSGMSLKGMMDCCDWSYWAGNAVCQQRGTRMEVKLKE